MGFFRMVLVGASTQRKNEFFNRSNYVSMTLWPILSFITTYYAYKPFSRAAVFEKMGLVSEEEIFVYLLLGFMSMMSFFSLIQSSWQSAYFMRIYGTLEIMYLTPVNRMSVILGSCIGSLLGSVWMISIFYGIMLYVFRNVIGGNFLKLFIGLAFLMVTALCWGVFLYSLLMSSRDGGFLYTIFQTPVEMFTGAKIPFELMPLWARIFGHLLPLTYVITLLRNLVLYDSTLWDVVRDGMYAGGVSAVLLLLAFIISRLSERNASIHGTATLF